MHDATASYLEHQANVFARSAARAVDERDAAHSRQVAAEFRAAAAALRGMRGSRQDATDD